MIYDIERYQKLKCKIKKSAEPALFKEAREAVPQF
jgi:hypothetical protein